MNHSQLISLFDYDQLLNSWEQYSALTIIVLAISFFLIGILVSKLMSPKTQDLHDNMFAAKNALVDDINSVKSSNLKLSEGLAEADQAEEKEETPASSSTNQTSK